MSTSNSEQKKKNKLKLGWKDYIAFTIALLETALLPFVLIIVALLVILAVFLILI